MGEHGAGTVLFKFVLIGLGESTAELGVEAEVGLQTTGLLGQSYTLTSLTLVPMPGGLTYSHGLASHSRVAYEVSYCTYDLLASVLWKQPFRGELDGSCQNRRADIVAQCYRRRFFPISTSVMSMSSWYSHPWVVTRS